MSTKTNSTVRGRIMNIISRRKNGITAYTVQNKLGVSRETASAALSELKNNGKVVKTTQKRLVPDTNRFSSVYALPRY